MNELIEILRGMADMLDGPQNAGNLVVPSIIHRFREAADTIEQLETEIYTLREEVSAVEEAMAKRAPLTIMRGATTIIKGSYSLEEENAALRERLDKKFKLIAQQGQELNRRDEVIKKQEAKLDHVTAERDAAMEDCSGMCITCAFNHD